ncbi:MAG: exported protein of unknown function [Candidatus Saccharibacteria bacterium]|nr:exported protein of unknown function [Candidatus Saccharibacteria bacterium]
MKLGKLGRIRIRRHHVPHICAGLFALVMLLGFAGPLFVIPKADADQLALRSVELSDPATSAADVNYAFGFTTKTGGPIGSILFEICENYQYEQTDPCTPPNGLDASDAVLTNQTGTSDFFLDPDSDTNTLIITRPAATTVSPQPLTYEFSGITNPSEIGSFYVRMSTYTSLDASGPEVDYGNVVFVTSIDIQITTEVPPYLLFCTGITIDGYNCGTAQGSFVSFGELSVATPRVATSQMLASTNAPYGYSITLAGRTLTAGNNVIPGMEQTGPSRPGTSQFGLNARSNTGPSVGLDPAGPGATTPDAQYNVPNQFRFKSGEIIASSDNTDDYRKLTVSYIVNRSSQQEPGRYVATLTYICLANF